MKKFLFLILIFLCSLSTVEAQNTIGFTQGFGSGFIRSYPSIESKSIYGLSTTSLQWRNYTPQLFVGCVGVDVEYMQRGFAYAPYTSTNNNDEGNEDVDLLYYYRYVNSIMVPIIWQPYVYMFHNRVRLFGDAAVTISYNFSSTYRNDLYLSQYPSATDWEGTYEMRSERDNSWGYGLAFGGGVTYIIDRLEIQASMRYYFGYSDLMKNRNKYYSNTTDNPAENPFSYTPMRSPIDNINIKVGVSYRLGRGSGYTAWYTQRNKATGLRDGFSYDDQSTDSGAQNNKGQNNRNSNSNSNNNQSNRRR